MPAFSSMTSSHSADVVVVGGGTVGAWTAVQLAERGVERVVLLEKSTLGDGASSRAAGMVRAQGGKVDPDKTMELLKGWKNPNSPRGPIEIDANTRDIIQNEYVREVRKVGPNLANVELETITAVKDPWKEINKKQ